MLGWEAVQNTACTEGLFYLTSTIRWIGRGCSDLHQNIDLHLILSCLGHLNSHHAKMHCTAVLAVTWKKDKKPNTLSVLFRLPENTWKDSQSQSWKNEPSISKCRIGSFLSHLLYMCELLQVFLLISCCFIYAKSFPFYSFSQRGIQVGSSRGGGRSSQSYSSSSHSQYQGGEMTGKNTLHS